MWSVDPDVVGQVEDLGQEPGRAEPFRVRRPGREQSVELAFGGCDDVFAIVAVELALVR